MKKLVSIIVLMLVIVGLSGCESIVSPEQLEEGYYPKEEIDARFEDWEQELQEAFNEELPQIYYEKSEIDEGFEDAKIEIERLQVEIEVLNDEIDNLQPTLFDRFITYMLDSGDIVSMELDIEYNETIEAYGYSKTYVYEVTIPSIFVITVIVEDDLDIEYCSDYANYDCEGTTVTRPLLGSNYRTYEIDVVDGFLVIEFESWDIDNDLEVWFTVSLLPTETD